MYSQLSGYTGIASYRADLNRAILKCRDALPPFTGPAPISLAGWLLAARRQAGSDQYEFWTTTNHLQQLRTTH